MAITVPEVEPQITPNFREQPAANETTFGGGPGADAINSQVQKIASSAAEIAIDARYKQDQAAVSEAQSAASRLTTDVLYDPTTGVLVSQGTNTLKAHKEGMTRLQKGMNDISMKLNGEAQIGAFNAWAMKNADASNTTMMGHVDKELEKHDVQVFDTLVKNQQGIVAMAHGNPKVLELGFQTVNENALSFAQRNNYDPEQTKILVQNANDKMHSSVIDGMLKFQNDDSADKYFEAHKDGMSPAMQEQMSKALLEGNIRNRSTIEADKIWNKSGGNLAEAFAEANKIENPAIREMTRDKIKGLQSDKVLVQEADQNEKFQQAWGLVKNQPLNKPVNLREIIPPMLWSKLLPSNQEVLKKLVFNNETNAEKYTKFMLMSPTELKQINAQQMQMEWLPEMAPKDRDKVMKKWQGGQANTKDSYVTTAQQHIIADYARMQGIAGLTPGDPNKPGHDPRKLRGDRAKIYHQYQSVLDQTILNYETTELKGQRPASDQEVKNLFDNLVITQMGEKSIGPFKFGGKQIILTPVSDIPQNAIEDLYAIASHIGVKPTREQIQQAYYYYQNKDKKGVDEAFR